jgi:glycerol kinase
VPGAAKCTYGTGAFLLATVGTRALRSHAGLVSCVAWRVGAETTYCLDGQVYTAGAAVQ